MKARFYHYYDEVGAPAISLYDSTGLIAIPHGDVVPSLADGTDWGDCEVGVTRTKTFIISNVLGTGPLTVTGIAAPTGYTQLASLPLVVDAGDVATFQVRFNAAYSVSGYAGNVVITSDDLATPSYTFAINAKVTYSSRVLAQSPDAYFPMHESSGTAMTELGPNAYTGTYASAIVLDASGASPRGTKSPRFEGGANSYANIYSTAFANAFNFDEFTLMFWFKMFNAAAWANLDNRYLAGIRRDANNFVFITKGTSGNALTFGRTGNGTLKQVLANSQSDLNFVCLALTVSIAGGELLNAGEMKVFKNKAQLGATQTGLVAAVGSGLDSQRCLIGLSSIGGTTSHNGWIEDFQYFEGPMTTPMLDLMTD